MRINEIGNLHGMALGQDAEDALRADAEAAWTDLDEGPKSRPIAKPAPQPQVAPALSPATAPARKAAPTSRVVTPKNAKQAKRMNDAARSDRERKRFIEDLRKVTDQVLEYMVKAVAQQERVGTVEFAQVRGYGPEIQAEAVRRYGQQRATAMTNAAFIKANVAVAPTPVVADPLRPPAIPADAKVTVRPSKSFMSKYGLWIGLGAAVAVGGFFFLRSRRAAGGGGLRSYADMQAGMRPQFR